MSTVSWQGTRPNTRMGALAILRKKLDDVRRKEQRKQEAGADKQQEITFSYPVVVYGEGTLLHTEGKNAHTTR